MHVYVIEMKNQKTKKWEPCADAHLTKKDAMREVDYYWRYDNKDDEFRVKKYVPCSDARGES